MQWDYRIVWLIGTSAQVEPQLKQAGWEGWEMVGVTCVPGPNPATGVATFIATFKRPLMRAPG
jgi:hypothetical protein